MATPLISEAAQRALKNVIEREKARIVNQVRTLSIPEPDVQSPDVYIAYTPLTGIPAMTGVIPGKADCQIYQIVLITGVEKLVLMGFSIPVYNLSTSAISASAWKLIWREKSGKWIALGDTEAAGTGTASDIDEQTDWVRFNSLTINASGLYDGRWYKTDQSTVPSTKVLQGSIWIDEIDGIAPESLTEYYIGLDSLQTKTISSVTREVWTCKTKSAVPPKISITGDTYIKPTETTTGTGGADNFHITFNETQAITLIDYVINHFDFTAIVDAIVTATLNSLSLSFNDINYQIQQWSHFIDCCDFYDVICDCTYCPGGAPSAYTLYLADFTGLSVEISGFYTVFWTHSCTWTVTTPWGSITLVLSGSGYALSIVTPDGTILFGFDEAGTGTREGACCETITLTYISGTGGHPTTIKIDPVGDCADADTLCPTDGITTCACTDETTPNDLFVNLDTTGDCSLLGLDPSYPLTYTPSIPDIPGTIPYPFGVPGWYNFDHAPFYFAMVIDHSPVSPYPCRILLWIIHDDGPGFPSECTQPGAMGGVIGGSFVPTCSPFSIDFGTWTYAGDGCCTGTIGATVTT